MVCNLLYNNYIVLKLCYRGDDVLAQVRGPVMLCLSLCPQLLLLGLLVFQG